MQKGDMDGNWEGSEEELLLHVGTDDASVQQNIEGSDEFRHLQDPTNDILESDLYRVDSTTHTTAAEERALWRKYVKWRNMERIPELRIVLRNRGNAAPNMLYGCDLKRVLWRIAGEVKESHDLIVLLRHHLGLDRLGDTFIDGAEADVSVAIELYRRIQQYRSGEGKRGRSDNSGSCCLEELFGFMLGEALNNIAFGKGNPSLVNQLVKATDAPQQDIEDRLYALAINRELLPKSLLRFVDPKTPLHELPGLIESMPRECSSEFISEYYEPFVVGIKAEGEEALSRIIESHLWMAGNIGRKYSGESAGASLNDWVRERGPRFVEAAEDEGQDFSLGDLARTRSIGLIEIAESEDMTLPLDDVIQEGAIGLIIAAEKFQPNQGTRYMSYAGSWVYQRILRAIKDQARIIRVPVHMVERIDNLVSVGDQLVQELRREPSLEEIGGRAGLASEKLEDIRMGAQFPVSLYSPLGDDGESSLSDSVEDDTFVSPFEAVSSELLKEQIDRVLRTLWDNERQVIELRFGLKDGHARTLEEVGRELSVTRQRVQQIEGRALKKLRHHSRSKWLKGYLE